MYINKKYKYINFVIFRRNTSRFVKVSSKIFQTQNSYNLINLRNDILVNVDAGAFCIETVKNVHFRKQYCFCPIRF